ncbi:UDP-galactopyranose mutase [bioreactor metagenome]|uniref:UDP-galactopyranose mutase n=1 Tax=bioreactor metagenome TaxID=1076179 RepID=A0A645EE54_9ZZZZ
MFDYLSRFTDWRDYQHRVVANVHGQLMPVPFNLRSLAVAFGDREAARLGKKLLATYGPEQKVGILELRRSEDPDLSAVADYVYENVFLHYTVKQWGTTPEEIDPATTARVPVFLSQDDRYFQDSWQGMPTLGYTAMFEKLLDHPGIELRTGAEAAQVLTLSEGFLLVDGRSFLGPVIYTGAADELFDCRFGRLPYRTLDFQFETLPLEWFQTHGTVNYTIDQPYTRITEFKHLTGQERRDCTSIVREYSRAYTGAAGEVPYYAIISPENNALYQTYKGLAAAYPNLHLLGRLAEYQYYNMDAIAARALALCDALIGS